SSALAAVFLDESPELRTEQIALQAQRERDGEVVLAAGIDEVRQLLVALLPGREQLQALLLEDRRIILGEGDQHRQLRFQQALQRRTRLIGFAVLAQVGAAHRAHIKTRVVVK